MYLISNEGYINAGVDFLRIRKTGKIWPSTKDVGINMGVKNISDLVSKEIHGICETKKPTKEQIKKYKMPEREFCEKFSDLSAEELNTKSNRNVYVRNNVMSIIIKNNRSEKKGSIRAIDGFRKKLLVPDSEIPECPEFEAKSKIGTIFRNEKILEE